MQLINSNKLKIIRKITLGLALAVCVGGSASLAALASAKTQDVEADLVFHNGFVYTYFVLFLNINSLIFK
jgi:hypothetical protein